MYMLSHNNFIDLSIICKENDELQLTVHVLLNLMKIVVSGGGHLQVI